MGAQQSNSLRHCLEEEFERLRKGDREYLVLSEILQIRIPFDLFVDLSHLGVLFFIDKNQDGRFPMSELFDFAILAASRSRLYKPHEFQAQMHGYCTLHLWNKVSTAKGKQQFEHWICALLQEDEQTELHSHPGVTFIGRDTIKTLHELLNIYSTHGVDFQTFFDLLQRVGEQKDLMRLDDEALDEVVPVAVVRDLASNFIGGFSKVMPELGFDPNLVHVC